MQKNMIAVIFHVESEAYQAFYELKKNRENFEISFIRLIQKKLDSYESIEEFKDEDVYVELSDIETLINRINTENTAIVLLFNESLFDSVKEQIAK